AVHQLVQPDHQKRRARALHRRRPAELVRLLLQRPVVGVREHQPVFAECPTHGSLPDRETSNRLAPRASSPRRPVAVTRSTTAGHGSARGSCSVAENLPSCASAVPRTRTKSLAAAWLSRRARSRSAPGRAGSAFRPAGRPSAVRSSVRRTLPFI